MRYGIVLMVLTGCSQDDGKWSPPAHPDPSAILQEARADRDAGEYETALAKHVWYHENALSIRPSQYGVRLSFAMHDWHELALVYPPAMEKLKETRDQAKRNVLEGRGVRESFHDMESINDRLGELQETQNVFEVLDETNPEAAKQVFSLAQTALVEGKAYSLLGKYVDPQKDYKLMRLEYGRMKSRGDGDRSERQLLDYANKNFAYETTTLVAILVVNDRKAEAEEIATAARAEWDDGSFHAGLDEALNGVFPESWPSWTDRSGGNPGR